MSHARTNIKEVVYTGGCREDANESRLDYYPVISRNRFWLYIKIIPASSNIATHKHPFRITHINRTAANKNTTPYLDTHKGASNCN